MINSVDDVKMGVKRIETLGDRIRAIRNILGLNQKEFSRKLAVSNANISAIELNKINPSPMLIRLISLQYQVNEKWLLTGEGEMWANPETEAFPMRARAQEEALVFKKNQFVPVPKVTGWLSAGPGSWELSPEPEGYYAFRADWIKSKGQPRDMVLMEVQGTSMYPTLRDRDYVLIDQGQKKARDDKLFAIMIGDEALVKRLRIQMDGRLLIVSDNRSESDPLGPYAPEEVTILGRVIWLGREL